MSNLTVLKLSLVCGLGVACLLSGGCGSSQSSSAGAADSPTASSASTPPSSNLEGSRILPGSSIPNDAIDAHIPHSTSPADRKIIRDVLVALPPGQRQYIVWMRVPPGEYGYDLLPNHGLLVMYCGRCPIVKERTSADFMGNFVLYYSGKVHTDSNANYGGPGVDKYLIAVPSRLVL